MPFSGRLGSGGRLAHGHRSKLRMRREHPVERPQEWAAATLEVLPRVLAVKNDRDRGLFPSGRCRKAPAGLDETVDEVGCGILGVPAGVHEPNQIREGVIAEETRDLPRAGLDGIRAVQRLRLLDPALCITPKLASDGPAENGLVGRHPLKARPGGKLCSVI